MRLQVQEQPVIDGIQFELASEGPPKGLQEFYAAQRHPVPHPPEKLAEMIRKSVCFVAARSPDGRLIGIARGMADGVRGYLTECKLDPAYQGPGAVTATDGRIEHDQHGIARAMAERVLKALKDLGCERIDVSAYGTEVDFCEELGFKKSPGLVPMALDVRAWAAPAPAPPHPKTHVPRPAVAAAAGRSS